MGRFRFLFLLFCLIWLLVLLHVSAEAFHLYWLLWWFDYLTHFIGGLWVGLAALWLCYRSGYTMGIYLLSRVQRPFLLALLAGVGIGTLWEGYEFVVWQLTGEGLPLNYISDTCIDLGMDILGSLMAGTIFHMSRSKDRH